MDMAISNINEKCFKFKISVYIYFIFADFFMIQFKNLIILLCQFIDDSESSDYGPNRRNWKRITLGSLILVSRYKILLTSFTMKSNLGDKHLLFLE